MPATRWNPWNELFAADGQAEPFLDEHHRRTTMRERMVQALLLDIRQTDEAFCIEASVPGFRPEDIEITFDENVLTIGGARRHEDETRRGQYVQREQYVGSVHRHVYLPAQVRADEITASFDNGILTIMVPRERKAQPKRILVTTAPIEAPKVIETSAVVASATA